MSSAINMGAVTSPAAYAVGASLLPANTTMTNHAKSKNNLSMLQQGTGLGSGTTVDVTIAQESNTAVANYNESAKLDAVDKSAQVSQENQDLLDAKTSEIYDVV